MTVVQIAIHVAIVVLVLVAHWLRKCSFDSVCFRKQVNLGDRNENEKENENKVAEASEQPKHKSHKSSQSTGTNQQYNTDHIA